MPPWFATFAENLAANWVAGVYGPTSMAGLSLAILVTVAWVISWHRRQRAAKKPGMAGLQFLIPCFVVALIAVAGVTYGLTLRSMLATADAIPAPAPSSAVNDEALRAITVERDGLKRQVATLTQQVSTLQQQVPNPLHPRQPSAEEVANIAGPIEKQRDAAIKERDDLQRQINDVGRRYPNVFAAPNTMGEQLMRPRLGIYATIRAVTAMQQGHAKDTRWAIIFTAAKENEYTVGIMMAIMEAAHIDFKRLPLPDRNVDRDAPIIPEPLSDPSIVLHGNSVLKNELFGILGCYYVSKDSREFDGMREWFTKLANDRELVWIEVGPGNLMREPEPEHTCFF
jgi:hypothetical protein